MCRLHGDFELCIQRFYHRLLYDMGLDIFRGYMQDALGIQDQLYIRVWVLFKENARLIDNLSNKYLAGSENYIWEQII